MRDIDFKDLREKIEFLIEEANKWAEKKSISESSEKHSKAQNLLIKLREMAENDIQERSVLRLSTELEYLGEKIDDILSKREAGKKEDGNIAFKCNWNDKKYKNICSQEAYEYNIDQSRAWCSSSECTCRSFKKEPMLEDHPCYESIALKELYFGAGWDHAGERNMPRTIKSVRQGRVAILTTRPPGSEEKHRLIVGCLYINKVLDDPGQETKIFGDREKSIEIDYDKIKIKFWNFYKNAGAEDLILWASGLFRYITDETVLNILKGIGEQYRNSRKGISKIIDLIKYYENIIKQKGAPKAKFIRSFN